MGETRVDLQHLLEDLRDAYTGAIEETILTEIVANALDSGATSIRLVPSPAEAALTVVDDGRGMQRRELARYHNVAASTKARGEGIGFAGVGIKLGLLVSNDVVTETRRGTTHVATRWHLASRHRAPWKWITAPGLTGSRGTAVRLSLTNPLSPLLDASYLERVLEDLADDFPLLRSLVDHRAGGQKRLPLPGNGRDQVPGSLFANLPSEGGAGGDGNAAHSKAENAPPEAGPGRQRPQTSSGEPESSSSTPPTDEDIQAGDRLPPRIDVPTPIGIHSSVPGRRRPARYGLLLQFESRPDDWEPGRLVDSTIWINEAHPAYVRATATRSVGYHIALSVALALAPLAVSATEEHAFVTQFLAHWGGSESKTGSRKRRRRR